MNYFLPACHLCGVSKVYKVGGASAIALLWLMETKTIPKVDVITGPGNIFVATAKKWFWWSEYWYDCRT